MCVFLSYHQLEKMKNEIIIVLFSLILLSCNENRLEIQYKKTTESDTLTVNTKKYFEGTTHFLLEKKNTSFISALTTFGLKKVPYSDGDSIWILDIVDSHRSKIGGCFYVAPSAILVSYFIEDKKPCFILDYGFHIAECQAERIEVDNRSFIKPINPLDSIDNWLEYSKDTLTYSSTKFNYNFDNYTKLNKKIKFTNTDSGLNIFEIENSLNDSVHKLETILEWNGRFELIETNNFTNGLIKEN